jgi:hypothetical protein
VVVAEMASLSLKDLGRTPWSPENEQEAMKRGRCGGRTRPGGTCINAKGYKTDHVGYGRCCFHGGATKNGTKAAEKERVRCEIARLFKEERVDTDDPVAGLSEQERRARRMGKALERYVLEHADQWWGPNHLGDTVPHIAVDLLGQWTDKGARISKLAIDVGIEERRVALTEQQGQILAEALRSLLGNLAATLVAAGLAQEVIQRVFAQDVPPLVRAALTSASGGEA